MIIFNSYFIILIISLQDPKDKPQIKRNATFVPECGIRNSGGVGVRITGDGDGESEYGGM